MDSIPGRPLQLGHKDDPARLNKEELEVFPYGMPTRQDNSSLRGIGRRKTNPDAARDAIRPYPNDLRNGETLCEAREWKRIYLDMPGHGKTPGADWITGTDQVLEVVEDFIDQVIPGERFVVAGNSYGADIGRGLVYRRGPQMDGLLLSVPTIIVGEKSELYRRV